MISTPTIIIYVIIGCFILLLFYAIILLILRPIILWYLKINKILKVNIEIRDLLAKNLNNSRFKTQNQSSPSIDYSKYMPK